MVTTEAKSCGTCTLCCKVLTVTELDKPGGVWCASCKPGVGCSIYEDRPPSCRDFACLWLLDATMPDELKPEHSKVVLRIESEGLRLVARCDPATPMAWQREPTYSALKRWAVRAARDGHQVMVVSGRRHWIIGPLNDLDMGESEPSTQMSFLIKPDGTLERGA
jgi:hypothetical protein